MKKDNRPRCKHCRYWVHNDEPGEVRSCNGPLRLKRTWKLQTRYDFKTTAEDFACPAFQWASHLQKCTGCGIIIDMSGESLDDFRCKTCWSYFCKDCLKEHEKNCEKKGD